MIGKVKQKYNDMPLQMKASLWFVVCGVLKDAIDILVTPIFTRILTKEQYGIFNVYNSWFQIFKIIFTLYLFSEVFNVGLVKFEKDRARFVSATLGFITTSVGVYFIVYLTLHNLVDGIIGLPRYLILLLFAHVLVYVPYYCWIRRERYDYHYKNVVMVSVLYIILQPITAIAAILWLNIPLEPGVTRVIAAVGIQIIIGIVLYAGMMFSGKAFFDKGYWKYSLKTGIELVPFNLSKVILNHSDRIMINFYEGTGDTGIYSVAHSAAFVLQAVTEALNGALVPWLYRRLKKKKWDGIRSVINGLLFLVAMCVCGIDLIAPEIMKILGNETYSKGVYCIPALVYSVFLIFLYTIITDIELFYGKNIYVTIASSVGMVVNIILNMVFIPMYGFIAAGYTTLAGYLVICIGHFIFLKKSLNIEKIDMSDIVDLGKLVLLSFLLLVFTIVCNLIYDWVYIRLLLVLAIALVVFIFRKKLIGFIKDLKGDKDDG